MSITMDHRLVAARSRPTLAPLRRLLVSAAFFLSFLILVTAAMAMRFYVYGPAEVWPRLGALFG